MKKIECPQCSGTGKELTISKSITCRRCFGSKYFKKIAKVKGGLFSKAQVDNVSASNASQTTPQTTNIDAAQNQGNNASATSNNADNAVKMNIASRLGALTSNERSKLAQFFFNLVNQDSSMTFEQVALDTAQAEAYAYKALDMMNQEQLNKAKSALDNFI